MYQPWWRLSFGPVEATGSGGTIGAFGGRRLGGCVRNMARALGSRFRRSPFMGLAFFGLLLALPATVGARSYSLDRVFVDARVDPDGSLWIDETRTYTFDGRYSWAELTLPLDRVGSVSEFSLSEEDRPFAPGTDEEPGTYQLESSDDELHVRWHYEAEDETRSFRLRYRISDAVMVHPDVAELNFQFVGELNPQAIGAVGGRPGVARGGGVRRGPGLGAWTTSWPGRIPGVRSPVIHRGSAAGPEDLGGSGHVSDRLDGVRPVSRIRWRRAPQDHGRGGRLGP